MAHPRAPLPTDPPVDWALYYRKLGWTLVAIPPGEKGPKAKDWNTPAVWLDHIDRIRREWEARPTWGMGLIHGPSGTCAIDVDAIEPTRRVLAEFGLDLERLLAGAPRIVGKRSGRDKAIFRAPEGAPLPTHKAVWRHPTDKSQSLTLFELRAGLLQDVLPPSIHPEGHRYEWRTAPWQLPEIPRLPDALLALWRDWDAFAAALPELAPWAPPRVVPVTRHPVAEGHNDVIGAFNRAHTVDALLQANGYVRKGNRYLAPSSTSKLPGVVVLEDGRVYSHHGSDPLADGHAHDPFDLFCLFDHHGDVTSAVTAASTLLGVPVYGEASPAIDTRALLAQGAPPARPKGPIPTEQPRFPAALLDVPGLVGDLFRYILRTARYPQPILALGAAIAGAATFMGRKVRTESDLRSNIYILAVAEAGSGKEHQRQALRKVFDQAGAFDRVAVEGLASDAAIVTAVAKEPSSLFLLDEIGRFLRTVSDPRAPAHLVEVVGQLLRLYSAASGPYSGKVYANAERNQVIQQPHLSIYGTTVPGVLHAALTPEQVEDGFLSRLLVFESETPDPEPVEAPIEPPPLALVEACQWWLTAPTASPTQGNLEALKVPDPRIISPDAGGRLELGRFEADMRRRRAQLRERGQSPGLYVRTAATGTKLALIRAAGRRPEDPVISREDAEWGCQLALFLSDALSWRVHRFVGENSVERQAQRILRLLEEAGGSLSHSELIRRTRWLRSRELMETLGALEAAGDLTSVQEKTGGRPAKTWVRTHGPPPEPTLSTTSFPSGGNKEDVTA